MLLITKTINFFNVFYNLEHLIQFFLLYFMMTSAEFELKFVHELYYLIVKLFVRE